MKRKIVKIAKRLLAAAAFLALLYFFPVSVGILFICGLWDISRNDQLDSSVLRQYFMRNGVGTWLASPLNILLDVLAVPYLNKGVYQLEDLPLAYREEIGSLLKFVGESDLVQSIARRTEGLPRAMFFFKWYGRNVESPVSVPHFHDQFKYVRTIGVSAFRERESTSRHFGPFRPCLRVLYCLNEIKDQNAYIHVGKTKNHWKDNRLFIFDDTLLHQSFNETDQPRYCLFVDVLRPSHLNFVFDTVVSFIRLVFIGINGVFYKNWTLVKN